MIAVLMWCRDGGIDATIDHGEGFMSSKEVTDIYSTEEPQSAFHARVAFCLDIHNEVSRFVYGQQLYSVYVKCIHESVICTGVCHLHVQFNSLPFE